MPLPVFCCNSSIFFEASALVQFWLNSSPASRQRVWRYDRCGPVIGSSFVTHSFGSFSGLSDAGGTSGTTSSRSIKVRFAPARSAGLALCGISIAVIDYAPVQRLVLRQNAICCEVLEYATATTFTQFTRHGGRFDQLVQPSSGGGHVAERV